MYSISIRSNSQKSDSPLLGGRHSSGRGKEVPHFAARPRDENGEVKDTRGACSPT